MQKEVTIYFLKAPLTFIYLPLQPTPIPLPRKLQVLMAGCWSGDIVLLPRNYIGCINTE